MNVNHDATKEALNKITAAVRRLVKAYQVYEAGMDISKDQAMYSAEYLKGLADKKLEDLVEAARNVEPIFDEQIMKAKQEEINNARIIDFADPRISGTLETIKNAKMTQRMIELIVSAFIGEAAALEVVQEAFAEKEIEVPSYMKDWFFDPYNLFDNLADVLTSVVIDPKNIVHYFEAQEEIEKLGRILGIKNVDLNIGINADEYAEQRMRALMGI